MSLNIPALAQAGTAKAWALAETALQDAVVNVGNTPTVDISADSSTPSWAHSITLKALLYGVEEVDEADTKPAMMGATARTKSGKILLRVVDMVDSGDPVLPDNDTEVVIAGVTWKVFDTSTPPGEAVFILKVHS